jgi:hypothetical protein
VSQTPEEMMAHALRLMLVPYRGSSDAQLRQMASEGRRPGGLGRHSPGEVLYARLALSRYDASKAVTR